LTKVKNFKYCKQFLDKLSQSLGFVNGTVAKQVANKPLAIAVHVLAALVGSSHLLALGLDE